jgi:hypothetical protein
MFDKSTKFVLEFCGLDPLGILAPVDIATLSCFNHDFLRSSTRAPCPFARTNFFVTNFSAVFIKEAEFGTMLHAFTYPQSPLFIMMETQAATHRCLEPFRWGSLRGWDFRPQLIVVSGLFGGNPFVDGILGHNLLLSQAFLVGIPSWMGF